MARVTIEDCLVNVENRFALVIIAAKRARQLMEGKEVYDVTGAGDTVISTLTVAKSVGASIKEACYIANAAASIAVSQLGTYAVGADELASLAASDKL